MEIEQLRSFFNKKALKATPQRLEIGKWMLSSKEHPTADQIYQKVKVKFPTISLTTVYQVLHLLETLGLLQELKFAERTSRYDPNTNPHINVICKECGIISDYESEEVNKMWRYIIEDIGEKVDSQRIDLYIKCEKCKNIVHK